MTKISQTKLNSTRLTLKEFCAQQRKEKEYTDKFINLLKSGKSYSCYNLNITDNVISFQTIDTDYTEIPVSYLEKLLKDEPGVAIALMKRYSDFLEDSISASTKTHELILIKINSTR